MNEILGYVSKTGHATYYRESITPELAALEHGGRKMWTPLVSAADNAALLKHGPPMQRGTCGDGTPWMGTMLDVLNDYKQSADAEARLGDEARAEAKALRERIKVLAEADDKLERLSRENKRLVDVLKEIRDHVDIFDVQLLAKNALEATK